MKIGFFDSGIGGVTVLYEALKALPNEDYIYYADTLNVPYGTKPKEVVKQFILGAAEFMINEGAEILVIACNTATSVAIEELRRTYNIPILGMEPAVKPAVEKSFSNNKRVLVTATPLTIKEEKLKNLITKLNNESNVDLLGLPGLVEFAENLCFEEKPVKEYLLSELKQFDLDKYGTIVLGCTHFPYFKDIFKLIVPRDIDIIDGSIGTVNNLKRKLEGMESSSAGSGKITYYNSGSLVKDPKDLEKFNILLKKIEEVNRKNL